MTDLLFCEQLIANVAKCFELDRISARVQEKHRRLLAHLSFETRVRFNHETNPGTPQPLRKRIESRNLEHRAKMRHRNIMAIDNI